MLELLTSNQLAVGGIATAVTAGLLMYVKQVPFTLYNTIKLKLTTTITFMTSGDLYEERYMNHVESYISKNFVPVVHKSLVLKYIIYKTDLESIADVNQLSESITTEYTVGNTNGWHYCKKWGFLYVSLEQKYIDGVVKPVRTLRLTAMWNGDKFDRFIRQAHIESYEVATMLERRNSTHKYFEKRIVFCAKRDIDLGMRVHTCTDNTTVVLKGNIYNEIVEDIEMFTNSRDEYNKLGISHHRGYLLYGPPGTGKSSLAFSLASDPRVHRDITYFRLSGAKNGDLVKAMCEHNNLLGNTAGKIIVLEDVDTVKSTLNRDDDKVHTVPNDSLPIDELFSVLDGEYSPYGNIVFILTTNHYDKLDPALIRCGRLDKHYCIDNCDGDQIVKLAKLFGVDVPIEHANALAATDISPAQVQEYLLTKRLLNVAEAEYEKALPFKKAWENVKDALKSA